MLDLSGLHPVFRPVATMILADSQERITAESPNSAIRPDVTFRTLTQQAAERKAGLSDLSIGMHNFGLALDVAVIAPNGDYVIDGTDRRYSIFGQVAKEHGCVWGGDWVNRFSGKSPDYDHCEMRIAGTVHDLLAWLEAHDLGIA